MGNSSVKESLSNLQSEYDELLKLHEENLKKYDESVITFNKSDVQIKRLTDINMRHEKKIADLTAEALIFKKECKDLQESYKQQINSKNIILEKNINEHKKQISLKDIAIEENKEKYKLEIDNVNTELSNLRKEYEESERNNALLMDQSHNQFLELSTNLEKSEKKHIELETKYSELESKHEKVLDILKKLDGIIDVNLL